MNLNIVLYQPEIPQNTGNIARTCVLTNSTLHLIKPMKFKIDDKQVKRAGLDYWSELKLEIHESYEDFMRKYGDKKIYLATTHGGEHYDEVSFKEGDFIMFGRESSGVPEEVHNAHEGIRVPMIKTSTRSLNLSNTVAIIAYEALRQIGFPEMK
ncbi:MULTISPECIES: tRNA (cytidine(34)-2'-O)-methyltransferase [unclassified Clostridium]|jgi:tRNA/rRNA methyltransferase|uniref:tRNA (cytidine(34)-2'-O)-methyltransferase n=1 Tax=unclassified Clostridium TaxID=2614128 RepID=UPI0025F682FC|nr:tRNA (cytidine(34)-2'-O)-methyltransferase [Clostridium sp.]MDY2629904.1 tRNA (cytidine(34)-2'-O)-methyltransferase [Clostridium sp.]MDY4253287.1 tRNA (cytidine(34)-2'-O)-methyltransferase [Clostridium sp.]MDY6228220.1 tRNA (cytidine(34)-2'-O)-methyltransferase [Clostridium sp.]